MTVTLAPAHDKTQGTRMPSAALESSRGCSKTARREPVGGADKCPVLSAYRTCWSDLCGIEECRPGDSTFDPLSMDAPESVVAVRSDGSASELDPGGAA